MNTYEIIKELAKEKKISIRQLEMRFGYSNGYLAKWSTNTPNADELVKLADFFDVSVDTLLGRTKKEQDSSSSTIDPLIYYRMDDTDMTPEEMQEVRKQIEFAERLAREQIRNRKGVE